MIMLCSGFIIIISERIKILKRYHPVVSMLFPIVNPIIYAMQTKELKALMAEMENTSYVPLKQPIVFTLEGFDITRQQGYPLFVVSFIVYAMMLLGNLTVVTVIARDTKLHKPMYVMMCNLAACDLLGGTVVMIQLMSHFLTGDKSIGYVAAIVQAFCVHTYAAATTTILAAMAYDRYVAICQPLHYHSIMTTRRLVALCFLAWFIAVLLIMILFILNVGTPLCGTLIMHVYSTNRSILRLACAPTPINNTYDLCANWFVSTSTFLVIAFSYVKILKACVVKQEKNSRSKALQTCASHLTIYILFETSVFIITLTYRLQQISPNAKKFCTILFIIVPPTVNPIIYGIAMKDIRRNIMKFFKCTVLLK
ncbi:olfactory receptor 52K2-like [Conger conger]|uniref:olfactory receptor 52K2-like n=1 Tax=Conger conger TaxID=82655 RepID=UPI002A59C2CD|nr:olfactory receptor 52K2-like [Conger conger]